MKTLMILGALEEFVPLVKLAGKEGIRTVVVDGNPDAPAKQIADRAYTIDIRDTAGCAEIAVSEHVDAVTTAYSDLLLECMVKIADAAHLPCHLVPAQLPYYRDKDVINRTCEELGIPTPKSVRLTESFSDTDLQEMSFPMVIKPLDLYGSRGLVIVHSENEIRRAFDKCCAQSLRREVLAEEYNPDHEFNMQCWVHQGQIAVLGIADREKTSFDPDTVPLSTRNIYPSRLLTYVREPALDALNRYIRKTGQTEGPLSMQFYWGKNRGFQVGEIAARFLGYEHELIEYATGVSIEQVLLYGAVDPQRLEALLAHANPAGSASAAVVYFHAVDGIVNDLSSLTAILQDSRIRHGQIFYQKGDRVGAPQSMPYAARYDIVSHERAEVDRISEEILAAASMTDASGRELLLKGTVGNYE